MKPITFTTSPPSGHSMPIVGFMSGTLALLDTPTIDGRRLLSPSYGQVEVRLPANIMTDYHGPYRRIGALIRVTIGNGVVTGRGVLYEMLPVDVKFWAGLDTGNGRARITRRHTIRFDTWNLLGVTLRDNGRAWTDLPPLDITPQAVKSVDKRGRGVHT